MSSEIDKQENKLVYSLRVIKHEGLIALLIKILQKLQRITRKSKHTKQKTDFLVKKNDILAAKWATKPKSIQKEGNNPQTITWVMSPPGGSSGGHQNIFRFIKHLDSLGYRNFIYLYSTKDNSRLSTIIDRISHYYDLKIENVKWLKNGEAIEIGDMLVATGWETAYPVYDSPLDVRKLYFVQDFEPMFYPMGSEYKLAENTYKFGFEGITAGKWLSNKLSQEYGMVCNSYDFAVDTELYKCTHTNPRKEIFFYARPVTARRGFELGILTLDLFHKQMPDYTINLAGWDASEHDIPFPYQNLKALDLSELPELYNRCAAGLVISLTNMSLLPLELLACGTVPVVTDGPNNRQVCDNPHIDYAESSPDALANALVEAVKKNDSEYAHKLSSSVAGVTWNTSVKQLEKTIKGVK